MADRLFVLALLSVTAYSSCLGPTGANTCWCGTSAVDVAARCGKSTAVACADGTDSACAAAKAGTCYAGECGPTPPPTPPAPPPPAPTPACTNCYCGATFAAASACTLACADGLDEGCAKAQPGSKCWGSVTACGPKVPTPPPAPSPGCDTCYCGATFQAATACSSKCPDGHDATCTVAGEKCWAKVTCVAPTPPPAPTPPTPAPTTCDACLAQPAPAGFPSMEWCWSTKTCMVPGSAGSEGCVYHAVCRALNPPSKWCHCHQCNNTNCGAPGLGGGPVGIDAPFAVSTE